MKDFGLVAMIYRAVKIVNCYKELVQNAKVVPYTFLRINK